ncbi:phosphate ABC transporter substrate-binding protein PstS [Taklimakanibacter deserti]|uniref:phosphate ABC transporter substrate-binding protein PstS n=1 Tax=Taklimakanibacter deserti TaxID=2267839 RepID=UPI000E6510EE
MKSFLLAFLTATLLAFSGGAAVGEPIHGAGSTFAYPVIAKWSEGYLADRAGGNDITFMGSGIDYEPVGSLAGILRLSQPEMDFAASDMPLPPEELKKFGYVQFPLVMGGIVPVVNLDGLAPGALQLSGEVLADIYLGKIQNWSDPAVTALNSGLKLPDLRITVIHRADGSGSTFNWTSFLSSVSAEWKSKYGADTLVTWPLGTSVERSSGVVSAVKETKGAIGYVEYGQVVRAELNYAAVKNRAGQFVRPEPAAFATAVAKAKWSPDNGFYLSLVDSTESGAYPITAATFILMRRDPDSTSRARQALWFFNYALTQGAGAAEALSYVPLPAGLVQQIKAYWAHELSFGS